MNEYKTHYFLCSVATHHMLLLIDSHGRMEIKNVTCKKKAYACVVSEFITIQKRITVT